MQLPQYFLSPTFKSTHKNKKLWSFDELIVKIIFLIQIYTLWRNLENKSCQIKYHMRASISRGLYTFYLTAVYITVACIIVRRLLISVHKWQSSGLADTHEYWSQHDAHLVYLPIFHGLNLIIFS